MPFGWDSPPALVAHRGAPREAPENTLASFRRAIARGARAIELDVRLTSDGAVVVHHDAELGRTVGGGGAVAAMTWADLKALDAGAWFSPAFAHERVPTLDEVLAALPPEILLDVELKADADGCEELPARVHGVVARRGALDRVLVTSFEPALASRYAEMAGRPAGSILPFAPDASDFADWPRLRFMALQDHAATPEVLRQVRAEGVTPMVWTVNDASAARAFLANGAAAVITDRPELLPPSGALGR